MFIFYIIKIIAYFHLFLQKKQFHDFSRNIPAEKIQVVLVILNKSYAKVHFITGNI